MNKLLPLLALLLSAWTEKTITIGSKHFTESYVLAEIAQKVLKDAHYQVELQGVGGSIIIWAALNSGQISVYPDYTGTIKEVILKHPGPMTRPQMQAALREYGIGMTENLGFNNTYALAIQRTLAETLDLHKISDLRKYPELLSGLSHEFLVRPDGWANLSKHYGLAMTEVRGMDHALAYAAMQADKIQLMNAYSTDGKLFEYDLEVLEDDLQFFPDYQAVYLYRLDLDPTVLSALQKLEGRIDEARMIRLNAEAERSNSYASAAALYFAEETGEQNAIPATPLAVNLRKWTLRHLQLVVLSLFFAVILGIPLGMVASRGGPLGQGILAAIGILQTIPSLALLALLVSIPSLGMSQTTAVIALFAYSLLPIVRNTASGLQNIEPTLRETSRVLGLGPLARLRLIYLPLATPTILAGIQTSAVINVGTATLAALIGTGGLGEPIMSGLALNDSATILQGAIPAALLAILVQYLFTVIEYLVVPKGLRIKPDSRLG